MNWQFTSPRVMTTEWIEGVPLNDSEGNKQFIFMESPILKD